jgi:hypothetical protein
MCQVWATSEGPPVVHTPPTQHTVEHPPSTASVKVPSGNVLALQGPLLVWFGEHVVVSGLPCKSRPSGPKVLNESQNDIVFRMG